MTSTQGNLDDLIFEDTSVEQVQIRIVGAGDGLSEALKMNPKALHHGDQVAFVLRGTVTQITFKEDKDESLIRLHTVKATGITEVELDMAKRILAANAESLARQKAALEGQMEIGETDEATTGADQPDETDERADDLEAREIVADLNERRDAKATAEAVPPVEFQAP